MQTGLVFSALTVKICSPSVPLWTYTGLFLVFAYTNADENWIQRGVIHPVGEKLYECHGCILTVKGILWAEQRRWKNVHIQNRTNVLFCFFMYRNLIYLNRQQTTRNKQDELSLRQEYFMFWVHAKRKRIFVLFFLPSSTKPAAHNVKRERNKLTESESIICANLRTTT